MSSQRQPFILPIINIIVNYLGKRFSVNLLYDTGSQRSYLCENVLKKFSIDIEGLSKISCDVNTMAGVVNKEFSRIYLKTDYIQIPTSFLVDKNLKINIEIPQIKTILSNLETAGFKIAPNYPKQENYFLDGIAGMDIIENIQHEIVDAMNGKAIKFDHGIVPIGRGVVRGEQVSKCSPRPLNTFLSSRASKWHKPEVSSFIH